jgi:hypothetical protein
VNDQGHPEFKTIRIADLLRECGVAPTDPMQDIQPGHRYLLFLNAEQIGNAAAKRLQEGLTAKGYDILALLLPPGSAQLFDASETGEEYFCYVNSALLCAECGWSLSPSSSNFTVRPFDYIVHCYNSSCSRKDIRFRVRASQGVRMERIDGKEETHAGSTSEPS